MKCDRFLTLSLVLSLGLVFPPSLPSRTLTIRTIRSTSVARQYHSVLYLIRLLFEVFEKSIQSLEMLIACPE